MCEKRYDNNSFKIKDISEVHKDIYENTNIYMLKRERDRVIDCLKEEITELTTKITEIKEYIDELNEIFHEIDTIEQKKIKK